MFIYFIKNLRTGDIIRGFETESEALDYVVQLEMSDVADNIFELDTYKIIREVV